MMLCEGVEGLVQPSKSGFRSSVTWMPVLNVLPQSRIGMRCESAILQYSPLSPAFYRVNDFGHTSNV